MKEQEQQNKEWEEFHYPEMPGDFFEQKIPSEPCLGCRKRDEIIKAQDELITRTIETFGLNFYHNNYPQLLKLMQKIEQQKNQL
jgi:hypothetical protein